MSKFTFTDVMVCKQIPALCPHVELDGSAEKFAEYMNDLADRIRAEAPPPFDPFKFEMNGVGEVIEPEDPRHPTYAARHPEYTPLETTSQEPPTSRG